MISLSPTLATWLLAAAPAVDVGVVARTEARSAWYAPSRDLPVDTPRTASPELALDASAMALLRAGAFQLRAAYSPRLVIRGAGTGNDADLLHQAGADATWRLDRSTGLALSQAMSFGRASFTQAAIAEGSGPGLPTGPASGPELVPGLQSALYVQSLTSARLEGALAHRLTYSARAGWQVQGGADRAAQEGGLPLQYGPEAEGVLTHALTRRDTLTARLAAAMTSFSNGRQTTTVDPLVGWGSRLSRSTSADFGLGYGLLYARDHVAGTSNVQGVPLARAALEHRTISRRPLSVRVGVATAPFVDRFTGAAYPRADLTASANWSATRDLAVLGSTGLGVPFQADERQGYSIVTAEAGASWRMGPAADLAFGGRWNWQRRLDIDDRPRADWGAYLSLTVRAGDGGT